jgi:hypothetical protein
MDTKREWGCPGPAPRGRQRCLTAITAFLVGLAVFLTSCTSLSPVSDDAKTLQARIRTGQALQQGDVVRVLTQDGVLHKLTVVSVEGDVLKGYSATKPTAPARTDEAYSQEPRREKAPLVEIPIADIVLVEKEKISGSKTAAAIGSGTLVLLSALLIILVASM